MFEDGRYYWCWLDGEETTFIALREDGCWYSPGLEYNIEIDAENVICQVNEEYDYISDWLAQKPVHTGPRKPVKRKGS